MHALRELELLKRIVSPFYNVTGLSAVLSQDESYKDVCEELILEHQHYLYCKPEYRLLYSVVKQKENGHGSTRIKSACSSERREQGKYFTKEFPKI
jgi:hypothetical protein